MADTVTAFDFPAINPEVVPFLGAALQVHWLKRAATLGATALAADAARYEEQLASGPTPIEAATLARGVSDAITAAGPGLASLLKALQPVKEPGATSPTPPEPPDADAVLTALRRMTVHLRNADMAATDAMTELLRTFGDTLGAQLAAMDDAIGTLDFERALRLCDDLIDDVVEGHPA